RDRRTSYFFAVGSNPTMVVIGGGDDVKSALRTWWLPLLATCSALAAKPDGGDSTEALVGLWGFEQIIGPLVAGVVEGDARRRAAASRATTLGESARASGSNPRFPPVPASCARV